MTLLAHSTAASYRCSWGLEGFLKCSRKGELYGSGNPSFNCRKRVFQQAGARGGVIPGQMKPSLHIWRHVCVLQSSPTLVFPHPPPPSYLRKHNPPKHAVCQISGVGIRTPDPSSSWQRSAGCVGAWKINLLARKKTHSRVVWYNPPLRCQQGLLEQGGWEEHQNPRVGAEGARPPSKHEQRVKQWLPKLLGCEQYGTVRHYSPRMGRRRLRQNSYRVWNRILKKQEKSAPFFSLATYDALTALWSPSTRFILKKGIKRCLIMKKCLICH